MIQLSSHHVLQQLARHCLLLSMIDNDCMNKNCARISCEYKYTFDSLENYSIMSNVHLSGEVELQAIQPKVILSKLPFEDKKCSLIISEQGNATALFRYSNAGPFVDLFDPFSVNLLPALKFSLMQGRFCIFNFGSIEKLDLIPPMLDRLKDKCSEIHKDLYHHIINNTLMKQSFDTLMSLIPFDPDNEMFPQIYENSKETVRFLFVAQIDNISSIKSQEKHPNLSLFNCIFIKP